MYVDSVNATHYNGVFVVWAYTHIIKPRFRWQIKKYRNHFPASGCFDFKKVYEKNYNNENSGWSFWLPCFDSWNANLFNFPEDVMNKVTSENGWESLNYAEKAFVNNVPLDMEDELENGDNIQIIARKEGGLK